MTNPLSVPFFKKTILKGLPFEEITDIRKEIADFFVKNFESPNFYTTKSCTQSLEMALMTLDLPAGKEVILPSYGFVSVANAVAVNGLKCIFVDCVPQTMNIDIQAVINAITKDTVAIITINYGGIACDYDKLLPICKEKGIFLIEDNAQGIRAKYKGRFLGSFGDISTISFDYLKNITCDEGGGISINNSLLVDKFEQTYYFGTNKARFLKGDTSFYEWKSKGTNALLAEPLAYILYKQVFESQHIIETYKKKWQDYYDFFKRVEQKGDLELAEIPQYAESNGHIFWIKTENENTRKKLMNHLFRKNIQTAFHYTPLHTSEFGKKMGVFRGEDKYTTKESARLLRLPLYYDLSSECQMRVIKEIESFYTDL